MEKSSPAKKLKKYVLIFSAVIMILFAVLMVHIYMVTKPVNYDNNNLQLARVDFKQTIDSSEAAKIRHFVASLPGVQNTMFNLQDGILVYGFLLGKQTSDNVFQQLMYQGHYKAEKFVPDEDMKTNSCPMAGKDRSSFVYRITAYIYKLLN